MKTQVNWHRIREELQRLADVDKIKEDVQRIRGELKKFDFHAVLSPVAAEKVKVFEKRYAVLMEKLHEAQAQMDREIERIVAQIKSHREDMSRAVSQQKDKLEQVSAEFKKRFAKRGAGRTPPPPAPPPKKTSTRKAAAKRNLKPPTRRTPKD